MAYAVGFHSLPVFLLCCHAGGEGAYLVRVAIDDLDHRSEEDR